MKIIRHFTAVWLLIAALPSAAQQRDAALADFIARNEAAAPAPLLPRDSFLEFEAIRRIKLSPDGRYVAYATLREPERRLYLLDTTTLASKLLLSLPSLTDIDWTVDSSTLLLDMGNTVGQLPIAGTAAPGYLAALKLANGDYYLGSDRTEAGGILVVRTPEKGLHILQRIDLAGTTTEIFRTSQGIDNAFLSSDGRIAFIDLIAPKQKRAVSVVDGGETELLSCLVIMQCHAISYDAANQQLWMLNNADSDLPQVERWSLADNSRNKVHSDPANVAAPYAIVNVRNQPVVLQYHDGVAHNYGFDAATNAHLAAIVAHFPTSNVTPGIGEGDIWLLTEESAVLGEPRYYLYNTTIGSFVEILANDRNAKVPPAESLSSSQPVHYRATDGMQLHGYVAAPKGRPLSATPLIALIHGGPWGRVHSNYSGLTQFLVNRGYIVFEPNFRASTGYGVNYMLSANRQFGDGTVQQDITDGVNYLLAQGIGDRTQLAIMGGSFGGFSVLAGLAFTPGLFKLGIASAPPAELGPSLRELTSQPASIERDPSMLERMRMLIADLDDPADMQRLHDKSPLAHLAAIKSPLLLLAGADDDRVSISHVKDYSLQLFNQRNTLSLLIDEDQGHGLTSPLARQAYFYLSETMLAYYFGGISQPLEDPLLAAYIQRKLLLNSDPALTLDQSP